eukprot:CAMPEP_0115049564 /NCGR_PEP_ID=MMETSP0227-20121206/1269_1 /TAXON_ID=89957 /ORGANISM="Polarella glacialis, Strain CCMP 1383" /LENGTH=92 /DNA_ID=CAMNT_0002433263 /DNA_START=833 /DNA_END=1111 /DNA_ORIENTATION=+
MLWLFLFLLLLLQHTTQDGHDTWLGGLMALHQGIGGSRCRGGSSLLQSHLHGQVRQEAASCSQPSLTLTLTQAEAAAKWGHVVPSNICCEEW